MIGFEWLEIQYRLITVLAFLSLFCNVILIILIYLKSPKKLGPYKHLMTFISIFEICYSIIDYLVVPVMHSYGTSFFIMTPLSHSLFEKPVSLIMLGVWCAFYGSSMALFGIHFIYRYLAVSGNKRISTFKGFKIVAWLIVPFIFGTIWGTISYFCCGPKAVTTNYIRDNLMQEFSLSVEDVTYMGPYFFNENGGFLFDTDVVMTLVGATSIMGTSLMTIFFYGWKCYKALSDVTTSGGFSKQYRALQRQFFLALVLQTVIPITLMHLPLLITYSGALFNVGLGRMSSITSITISLYPVIDPLPSIFIIKNYKEGLKKFLMTPVKFCLTVKNKKAVNVAHIDGTSSRRTSKLPDDDNVSVWGEI
ncbi:hypothetical protein L5515_008349 [Caenorhabditis briggsae]|uniref:Serpentine receptor class r-10 n=1 Tax=Caenorhabditis briggsae TaxID=6238 RepID=A0AAE9F8E9_CAEBR|nr:hypothetical protein L5515_008349 [Caenorhabditis briggsae]